MLNYVYEHLEKLAAEANCYIFKENRLNHKKVEMTTQSMKSFIKKLKDAFKEIPEAIDEIEWLEMVVKNIEEKENGQQTTMKIDEQERI